MSINVKASVQDLINQAFAANKNIESLDFVGRLFNSELETAREAADKVLNPDLIKPSHCVAYQMILDYALERHSLTETVGIMQGVNLQGTSDIVENNIRLLAETVDSYDNTWSLFKKTNLIADVNRALDPANHSEAQTNTMAEVNLTTVN